MNGRKLTPQARRRVLDDFSKVPFVRLLGMELEEAGRGSATIRMNWREEFTQTDGLMHGGAVASLIDTASAFAVLTLLEPQQKTSTVDLTIHYLRPVLRGQLQAHARVLRAGNRIVVVSVDVKNPGDELTATALTTYTKHG